MSSKAQWLSGLYYADFINFYSPTQLCGGGTTKSKSNELPISVPLSFFYYTSTETIAGFSPKAENGFISWGFFKNKVRKKDDVNDKRGWDKSPSLLIVFGLSSKTQWLSELYYADFISFYSPTQLCGGGTTKSNSNE